MENVTIYSPINDEKIKRDINGSPIWKNSYHADELSVAQEKHEVLYEYKMKFEGVKPIQVTSVKKVAK